jgi:hypothetical protein
LNNARNVEIFLRNLKEFDIMSKIAEELVENRNENFSNNEKIFFYIFKNFFFRTYKREKSMEKLLNFHKQIGVRRGRRAKEEKKKIDAKILDQFLIDEPNKDENIYINFIELLKLSNGYNVSSNILKPLRCRMFENGKWRDCDPNEVMIYGLVFKNKIIQLLKKFQTYKFFGLHFPLAESYRIVNNSDTEETALLGKLCGGKREDVLNVLWYLKKESKEKVDISMNTMKEYLNKVKIDYKDFSDEKIKFYVNWLFYSKNINSLCENLYDAFEEKELILDL